MSASTPASRSIQSLRNRARRHQDPGLSIIADEMERMYVLLVRRGAQLQFIEQELGTALSRLDNEVSLEDREALR